MSAKDDSEAILNNLIRPEIILLKISGISLTGYHSTGYKIFSVIMLFLLYLYPILQLIGVIMYPAEVDFETVYAQFALVLITGKNTIFLLRRNKIRESLVKLGSPPFTVNLERGGDVEEELAAECKRITRIQRMVYFGSFATAVTGTFGYSLITRLRSSDYHDWRMPFGKQLLFNVNCSPYFEIVLIYELVSSTLAASALGGIDSLTYFTFCQVSYQFKFLQNSLRLLVRRSYNKMIEDTHSKLSLIVIKDVEEYDESKIPWKYLQQSLREAVNYHLEIISIVKEMESVFNILFLVILLCTMAILCFMIYRLSIVNINNSEGVKYVVQIVVYIGQIILLSFWGEQVIQGSKEVGSVVYETDFVGTDPRFQNGLILIMRRSQLLTKITAGKFTDIGLATFVWFARTTYGTFMLLRNVNQNKDV